MTPLQSLWTCLAQLFAASPWIALLGKASLLLAAAWLMHFALAQANPRWRALLWRGVAVGLTLILLWTLGLPHLEIPVRLPERVATIPVPLPQPSASPASTTSAALPAVEPLLQRAIPPSVERHAHISRPIKTPRPAIPWRVVLLGIWAVVALGLVVRLTIAHHRVARLVRGAKSVPESVAAEAQRIALALGCRRPVALRSSPGSTVPFLYGLRHPTIILPEPMCEAAASSERTGVLAHELAHVRSSDLLWSTFLQFLSILLWFHPFAWRIGSAHRSACDAVCDALSASYLGNVQAYCQTLARVALATATSSSVAALAMARPCDVLRRVAALERKVFSSAPPRRTVAGVAIVALGGVAMLAGVRLTPAQTPPHAAAASATGKGVALEGTVTDPDGRPAAIAAIALLPDDSLGTDHPKAKADWRGHYHFLVSKPGDYTVAAAANGYAPDSRHVSVVGESKRVDLQLRKGEMIRLRVVDNEGKPIPGATVSTVFIGKYERALLWDYEACFKRPIHSDQQGRWSKLWIPKDVLTLQISKPGYKRVDAKVAPSEEEQVVTLRPGGWSISGRVADAQTKAAIMNFRVVEGYAYGDSDLNITWHETRPVANQYGQYRVEWDASGDSHRVLRIEADAYLPSEARRLKPDEQQVTWDVALSKGQEITGTVRSADGKPVAGAEVALCTATRGLYLQNGRPLQGQPNFIVRTSPDGRFSLPPQRELYCLVVLHDHGFAQVDDKKEMKDIVLQPWARVEGTLLVESKPGANETITIDFGEHAPPDNPSPGQMRELAKLPPALRMLKAVEMERMPLDQIPKEMLAQIPKSAIDQLARQRERKSLTRRINFDYRTQTDEQGHFLFERVRPGKAKICRQVMVSQEGRMSAWRPTNSKSVEFTPGQTLAVDLTGIDASVIRQRYLAEQKARERGAYRKQDDAARQKRVDAALKVLHASPPASQEARIQAAVEILRNYSIDKDCKPWATALRELFTIGKPAVPTLTAELDQTENNLTLRAFGFALRGIGDPRAVPALIRAIPRCYASGGSDFGLRIDDDPAVMKFMQDHDNRSSAKEQPTHFSFGRPIREIMPALEKITGQSLGWMELKFADTEGYGAQQQRIKRTIFLELANRWADWWSRNWQKYVPTEADAQLPAIRETLDRYAEAIAKMPHPKPPAAFPSGPNVLLAPGRSQGRLTSFEESPSEAFVDIDSGRHPDPPRELIKSAPGGEPSKELLAWTEREGVDLITVKLKLPGSEEPAYAFMPVGMRSWRIDNSDFDDLQNELPDSSKSDFPPPWNGPLAQIDPKTRKFDKNLTASFLFMTKEGVCGAIQLRAPMDGTRYSNGGLHYKFIYEPSAESK